MNAIKYFQFYNQKKDLPLLSNYVCSFESMSGQTFTPTFGESDTADLRIVLRANGNVVCTSDVDADVGAMPVTPRTDFKLALRHFPSSAAIRIPFEEGRICEDVGKWKFPETSMTAQVIKAVPSGFLVRVDDSRAFLPNSFIPQSLLDNSGSLIKKIFRCEVVHSDGKHDPVVKPTGSFISFDEWLAGKAD